MDRLFDQKIWGVPWSVLTVAALAIAVVYLILDTSHDAEGLAWFVLRWFHSICWLFLALAALTMSKMTPLPPGWAIPLAATGGGFYAIFVITGLVTGKLFQ